MWVYFIFIGDKSYVLTDMSFLTLVLKIALHDRRSWNTRGHGSFQWKCGP
jgi:hypothetical protein